ncbi:response regulator [Spirosoma arcticum]
MTTSSYRDSTTRNNFKNAQLLIIEDNPDHGIIISNAVRQCLPELKIVLIPTEQEVMAYLDHCRLEEWDIPKLVILDLYLPDRQNGWRLLEQIRAMPMALSKTPVVILSSSGNRSDVIEAYERGCSSYLVKPRMYEDWLAYFRMVRTYWWETVTLPNVGISSF